MTEGLLVFLGLICAAVLQVMPLTANFLQGEVLQPQQIQRLSAQLQRQQDYWVALFVGAVLTALMLIFSKAFSASITAVTLLTLSTYTLTLPQAIVFILVFMITFVFSKVFGIFAGLSSLAKTRRDMALLRAEDRMQSVVNEKTAGFDSSLPNLPENYGSIIH